MGATIIDKAELEARLAGLSEDERRQVLSILGEIGQDGRSATYESLVAKDYREMPVDIETFLTDDAYLGKPWKDALGKSKVYPFWMDTLKEIFPTPFDTAYETLLESGARGLGKSEIACGACGAYLMYRVLCLANPLAYYRLKPTEKIVFAFMNIKKDLAWAIAMDKFQKTIQLSPWFMARGKMTQRENEPFWVPPEPLELIIGSQSDDVIGLPVYFAFFDEISFIRNQDIDKQKKKAKDMIDTAIGGMFTRFIHDGRNPTLLVVASSKRSEQSFMENYIKELSDNGRNVKVVDEAVWNVKPKGTYSDKTFFIGLGNKFLSSIVIPDRDSNPDGLRRYRDRGYQIIEAPIDFKEKAHQDIERMLCDFAGISSYSANKYFSAEAVQDCIDENMKNPFPDVIEVGNAKEDRTQYQNLFDAAALPSDLTRLPLFIHLDMSKTGDMTGIAGVWIVGKKESTGDGSEAKDLAFRVAFSVSVKAPKGYSVSYAKNRAFVRWLKDSLGLNVRGVSADQFQSVDTLQQLEAEGYETKQISVDRVDTDGICHPYQYLKSCVYEGRIAYYKSDRLYDEFVDVERNMNTGKVDHTPNGHKDALDAVCGAVWNASKHAEEFAYSFGEGLSIMAKANGFDKPQSEGDQLTVAFDEQVRRLAMAQLGIGEAPAEAPKPNHPTVSRPPSPWPEPSEGGGRESFYDSQDIIIY